MAEGTIVLPPDSTGKAARALTGGANQPASTYQPVDSLADSTGTLLGNFEGTTGALPTYDPDMSVIGTITAASGLAAPITTTPVGTAVAAGSYVQLALNGEAAVSIAITNNTGATALYFEVSGDGIEWIGFNVLQNNGTSNTLVPSTTAATVLAVADVAGYAAIRVRAGTTYTAPTSGSITVALRASSAPYAVHISGALPSGSSAIGTVGITNVTTSTPSADAVASPVTLPSTAYNYAWNGSSWDRQHSSTVNGQLGNLNVNIAGSAAPSATTQNTITTSGQNIVFSVAAAGNITIALQGGSYTGTYTVVFESSSDGGTTYQSIQGMREDNGLLATGDVITGSAGPGPMHQWTFACPGVTQVRVRSTGVPGTITTAITVIGISGAFFSEMVPTALAVPVDGSKASYSAPINAAVATSVAAATDFWYLQNPSGSGKVIRVTRLFLQLTAATATAAQIELIKRTTLNAGGTVTTQAGLQHDSNDAAPSGTTGYYTAAATTLGTASTILRNSRIYMPTTIQTAVVGANVFEWYFGNHPAKAVVLRPAQQMSIYAPTAPAYAPVITGEVEWTEETW